MRTLLQDMRFGIRMLVKSPGFAVVAVLTLAIGIGANTAIFTVLNSVLLRPLPFHDPDRLVIINERAPQFDSMSVSYQNFLDWKAQSASFEKMAIFRRSDYTLTDNSGTEHVTAREVSAGFLGLLGTRLELGRDLQPEDDHEGAGRVAILSFGLWQRRFGGSPDVLGKVVHLNEQAYTVVGVTPKEFWFYSKSDLFLPFGATGQPFLKNRMERPGSRVIGRLKPGVSIASARAEVDSIAKQLAVAYPEANAAHGAVMKGMLDHVVSDSRSTLELIALGVGLLLVIACVNVANLLLSRVVPRQREIAIRTALGASRSRVAGQLLAESVMLSMLGGVLGIGLAWAGTKGLLAAVPNSLPRAESIGVDWRVAIFLLLLCFATGILFGMAPVWQVLRGNMNDTLKESVRGSSSGKHMLQSALVVTELALAVLLLVGAGLTVRTLQKLATVDPGFQSRGVLTFDIGFSKTRYNQPEKVRNLFHEVTARLQSIPGVEAAATTTDVMMRDDSETMFYISERPKPAPKDYSWSMMYITSPAYLKTMKIRQVRGRFFNDHDNLSSSPVIVVDEELAHTLFPNEEAIGHHIVIPFPGAEQPREIIGVVQHVKHWGLVEDATAKFRSEFYMPFDQVPDSLFGGFSGITYAVRSNLNEQAITTAVKQELRSLDSDIPVYNVSSMDEIISLSIARQRFLGVLLVFFGCAALLLGAVGTYGVISYSVSQRTNEMGIRMALGAQASNILGLVLGRGAKLIACGVGCGLVVALLASRLMASFVFGITARDPVTFGGVGLLLLLVAAAACYVPARRATMVDPMIALRHE
ncbi:MAG TPA: ABC transporter permease [Candidatus Angelobacter sp.]|nr:ABC transporter permease [Candidatus Angelobacter sp.]